MLKFLLGNSLWQLIVISDAVSKFVLLLLLGMSIVCWTIFLYKLILARVKQRHLKEALRAVKGHHTINDLNLIATRLVKTVPGYYFNSTLGFIKSLLTHSKSTLTDHEWELVEQHVDQTYDEIVEQEEMYMPVLYSCAGVATLIGLFGTVWGLVHAFVRIGEKQAADIVTVAPGIAEALITTLAGLMVAIPAYVMFHYLSVKIKKIEAHLSSFADLQSLLFKKLFVNKGVKPWAEEIKEDNIQL
jgi:biopolymer transport protein TolQ